MLVPVAGNIAQKFVLPNTLADFGFPCFLPPWCIALGILGVLELGHGEVCDANVGDTPMGFLFANDFDYMRLKTSMDQFQTAALSEFDQLATVKVHFSADVARQIGGEVFLDVANIASGPVLESIMERGE